MIPYRTPKFTFNKQTKGCGISICTLSTLRMPNFAQKSIVEIHFVYLLNCELAESGHTLRKILRNILDTP